MMSRRVGLAVVTAVLPLAVASGCGNDPANPATDSGTGYYGVSDVLVNGHMITCVHWKDMNAGGLSCDFTHPH